MAEKRTVEVDLANERVVLATMIHDESARKRLARELRSEDFGDAKHRALFRALMQIAHRRLAYSEDTVAELTRGEETGGFEYLRSLAKEYEPNQNLDFHVERLRVDAAKFDLLDHFIPKLSELCQDPTVPPERISQLLRAASSRVDRGQPSVKTGSAIVNDYFTELRARRAHVGVRDGWGQNILDSVFIRGFGEPGITILAGRPGTGKSTLLASLIRHRMEMGRPTFIGGWEMKPNDYMDMFVSAETGISATTLSNAITTLTDEQRVHVTRVAERYGNEKLLRIQKNPFTSLEGPRSNDRFFDYNRRNLDLFESIVAEFADDFPLFALDVFAKMLWKREPDEIAKALMRLAALTDRYNVHFLLLHHMNRGAAQGAPTLEGLKGAGALEEDAHNVFALDRPLQRASAAQRRKNVVDHLDIHILKQRKGPAPLCVRYRFDGSVYSISDETEMDLAMLEKVDDGEGGLGV